MLVIIFLSVAGLPIVEYQEQLQELSPQRTLTISSRGVMIVFPTTFCGAIKM